MLNRSELGRKGRAAMVTSLINQLCSSAPYCTSFNLCSLRFDTISPSISSQSGRGETRRLPPSKADDPKPRHHPPTKPTPMPTMRQQPSQRGSRPSSRQRRPKPPVERTAARNHFVAATGEFVGTFMFLYLAFLGHSMAATTEPSFGGMAGPSNQQVVYVSLAYGLSLLVTAWTLYRVSGGM